MSDQYIILEGGLVTNDPALPVFDLDLLDVENTDELWAEEAIDLYYGLRNANLHSLAADVFIALITAEWGWCDECRKPYPLGSRDGRCGDCGNCSNHCQHKEA